MRDWKLLVSTNDEYDLDLDIQNGEPVYVDNDAQTNDQRASVAAYKALGSVPGDLGDGIDWTSVIENENNIVSVDNQIKQAIESVCTVEKDGNPVKGQYSPVYVPDSETGIYKVFLSKAG